MMRFYAGWLFVAAFLAQAQCQSFILERATTVSAPNCSVTCLVTLIPEYCGSLTNTTCICTSTELTAALTPCALAACNITEALQLQRYSAESCGVTNDKTCVQEQLNVYYVLPALSTCFVLARLYIRTRLDVGLGADDWMMLAALAGYLTDVRTGTSIVAYGFGQHTFWLTTDDVSKALMVFYISELFYLLAITLTKLSLLLFFRRIFPDRNLRTMILIMGCFIILSNFALTMALCFQCQPFHGAWTNWMYKVPPVKCIKTYTAVFVAAGLSITHDLIIILLPIPTLWKLNLAWQKKLNLLVMFSVGSFVIMCSLLRLPSLFKLKNSSDPSYDQAPIAVWTNLEVGVGIICGCLPAFRSLIGYLFPSLKMSLGPSNGDTPAYPAQPRSGNKLDRKRVDTSTRTFIELNDRTESQEELERGTAERSSIVSQDSETPIHEKLVPNNGKKGYSYSTKVDVRVIRDPRAKTGRPDEIVMTKTVEQSREDRV